MFRLVRIMALPTDLRMEPPVRVCLSMRIVAADAVEANLVTGRVQYGRLLLKTDRLRETHRSETREDRVIRTKLSTEFIGAAMAFAASINGLLRRDSTERGHLQRKPLLHPFCVLECSIMAS